MVVVSDLDDINVKVLYSATKIYLFEGILSPGIRLLGVIRILRADPKTIIGGYVMYTLMH